MLEAFLLLLGKKMEAMVLSEKIPDLLISQSSVECALYKYNGFEFLYNSHVLKTRYILLEFALSIKSSFPPIHCSK